MIHDLRLVLGIILIGLGICGPATAQMYRCGSTYQDQPCEGGGPSKKVNAPSSSAAGTKAGTDSECIQRGNSSLKISWSREAGASAEKLLAEAKRNDERKLIADVFQKRGNAADVRAAIEADCIAEKERLVQAAALAAAAARLAGPAPAEAGTSQARTPSTADNISNEEKRRHEAAVTEAERKKSRCAQLEDDINNIRLRQRAGGSAGYMDQLNQKRRATDQAKHEAGCGTSDNPLR